LKNLQDLKLKDERRMVFFYIYYLRRI